MSRTKELDEYDTFYSEIFDSEDLNKLAYKIKEVGVSFVEKDGKIRVTELFNDVN